MPPWLLRRPRFNFSLYGFEKNSTSPEVLHGWFAETRANFGKHLAVGLPKFAITRMARKWENLPLVQ